MIYTNLNKIISGFDLWKERLIRENNKFINGYKLDIELAMDISRMMYPELIVFWIFISENDPSGNLIHVGRYIKKLYEIKGQPLKMKSGENNKYVFSQTCKDKNGRYEVCYNLVETCKR